MSNSTVIVRQQEKPAHYNYLKSFRVEQCNDFVHFQCPKHKPFSCFNWHFPNQKRRRPVLNRDGKFNYSADHYCTKYDEFTGLCPDKDACPLLHKTVGDTEHLYHLRHYKVELCSGSLNNQGHCERNGLHCAFAHGSNDLRQPVLDANERNHVGEKEKSLEVKPIEKVSIDDSSWCDKSHLLTNFKTKECPTPNSHNSALCPHYHHPLERRRSPSVFQYSAVKCSKDNNCGLADSCKYSHNSLELHYHPDLFRTVLCQNDQPHSPVFCPFIHAPKSVPSAIPSSSATSSSSSSSINFHATIPTSIGVDKTDSESNVSHSKSDTAQEEHFYDVLDAISDYKICNNNTTNTHTVVNEGSIYTPPMENIPFTNDIAYINPCGPIGRNYVGDMEAVKEAYLSQDLKGNLDDDPRPIHPPGFEKKLINENEISKMRSEKAELLRRLQQEVALKEAAFKERDKILSLLESFKIQPEDQDLLQHLSDGCRLENLSLCSLFKLQSRLNEDVAKINKAMFKAQQASEQRCSRCVDAVARMDLSCGHCSYCYACYIAQVACPQCATPVFNY